MSVIHVAATDQGCVDRAEKLLASVEGGAEKAIRSAVQRSAAYLRRSSTNAVRTRYAISASNIRANENVSIRYTYQAGMQAIVTFAGYKIPLYRYQGTNPMSPTPDKSRMVTAIIQGKYLRVHPGAAAAAHQLKGTSPKRFENAFVAQMRSGHIGIFERTGGVTGSGSDAIQEIMGSSVPQMLGNDQIRQKLAESAMEKFEERLEHEINAILSGWR